MSLKKLSRLAYQFRLSASVHTWPGLLPRAVRPLAANLRLTHNCQAKCVTCDFWKERTEDPISTDMAVKTIDRLAGMGIIDLYISGGEPLLRQDLFEILERADTDRFSCIAMQTNGLLLKKLHHKINASPITGVAVSLDAIGERNDLIRGIKGYFDLAVEGAKHLRGKDVVIRTNLNGPGAEDLEVLIDLAESNGWRFVYGLLDDRSFYFSQSDVLSVWPDESQVEKILRILKERLGCPGYELDYVRKYLLRGRPVDGPDEPPCFRGFNIVSITSEGDVWSGCYVLPPVGNIFETDIGDIVSSGAYRERSLAMLRRECAGCTCGVMQNVKMGERLKGLARLKGAFGHPSPKEEIAAAKKLPIIK